VLDFAYTRSTTYDDPSAIALLNCSLAALTLWVDSKSLQMLRVSRLRLKLVSCAEPRDRRRKTNSPKVRQSLPAWASYLPKMPEPKVCEFSKHIADLCATRGTDVFKLAAKLGTDPIELLRMINGKVVPTRAVISGLAKELHSNVSLLTKLTAEIKP
jgi:hypothetical protein